jgi:putative oxidoreductase
MDKTKARRVARAVLTWLPALLLATIFIPQGWAKFSESSGWAVAFRHWGYPAPFRMFIGGVEIAAVLLLLTGRQAALGALLIAAVMLGAMGTHLALDGGRHLTSEVVPLTLSLAVLWMRRNQLRSMSNRAPSPG